MRRIIIILIAALTFLLAPLSPALAGNKGGGNFCPGRNNSCPSGGGGGGGGGSSDPCSALADGTYLINLQAVVCIGGVTVSIL